MQTILIVLCLWHGGLKNPLYAANCTFASASHSLKIVENRSILNYLRLFLSHKPECLLTFVKLKMKSFQTFRAFRNRETRATHSTEFALPVELHFTHDRVIAFHLGNRAELP